MRNARPFYLLACALLVSACSSSGGGADGGGGGGASPGSCKAGTVACSGANQPFCCADYGGNFKAATVQNDCNISGGMYSSSVCATASRLGSCTLYPGTIAEKTIRYYTGYTGDAQQSCTALHGTWAAN